MPLKKAKRLARPIRLKKAPPSKKVRSSRAAGRPSAVTLRPDGWSLPTNWVVVLGVICVLGAVALIATPLPSPGPESVTLAPLPGANTPLDIGVQADRTFTVESPAPVIPVVPINQREALKAEAGKARPVVANAASALEERSVKSAAPAAELASAQPPAAALTLKASPQPSTPPRQIESNAPADVRTSAASQISGCLEVDDGTFRLKDITGADAPTARSWKSGFLRKRSSSIEIVDAAPSVRVPSFIGQRVIATGTLIDRQMQVRSLQALGACS